MSVVSRDSQWRGAGGQTKDAAIKLFTFNLSKDLSGMAGSHKIVQVSASSMSEAKEKAKSLSSSMIREGWSLGTGSESSSSTRSYFGPDRIL